MNVEPTPGVHLVTSSRLLFFLLLIGSLVLSEALINSGSHVLSGSLVLKASHTPESKLLVEQKLAKA